MAINTGNFGLALWPGINAWYGAAYNQYPTEYTDLFDTYQSSMNSEEDVSLVALGLMTVKPEGQPTEYDTMRQGFRTRYRHVTYSLGFVITKEMLTDNKYSEVGKARSEALARSVRQTKETIAANVYNRAFNGNYTGGDGLELLSTAHLNVSGGTWANELSTAADLSPAALEQATIDIGGFEDDRGLTLAAQPMSLIIHRDNQFNAKRILESPLESGSSDNDINAVRGMFPKGVKINHYLTDADAWFIRVNVPNSMKHFERWADEFEQDNDFDTSNLKYKATSRYSFGWSDPRGLFGSPGAP
jgi:hypothetical protein